MKLLLAEDELPLAEAIVDILKYHHYEVDTAHNGTDALSLARRGGYSGLLLDIMMPGLDGLTVLRELRLAGDSTPVMFLTAKGEVDDRVAGLDAGADDYLSKPFAMSELLARVRALTRRQGRLAPEQFSLGNVVLSEKSRSLTVGSRSEPLSKLEYRLMALLIQNPGMYFTAEMLLEQVWGLDSDAEVGTVWVYISYLRKKLSALNADVTLHSRRGVGYTLQGAEP